MDGPLIKERNYEWVFPHYYISIDGMKGHRIIESIYFWERIDQ